MKTRILVALIAVPALFVVLFFLPGWVLTALVSALAAIAVWEMLFFTGVVKHLRVLVYATAFAAAVPFWKYFALDFSVLLAGLFILMLLVFAEGIFAFNSEKKLEFTQVAGVLFAALLIPLLFSSLIQLKAAENGRYYVLLPFILAFVSDGGAYFAGVFLGKHKLAPHVSPKKTVEGALGGIVANILFAVLYGLLLQRCTGAVVSYPLLILYGVLGSVISQLGDLSFSLLKRGFGVKDYGRLIPGHGGVLDRFDSVLFAAPAAELLLAFIPAFHW